MPRVFSNVSVEASLGNGPRANWSGAMPPASGEAASLLALIEALRATHPVFSYPDHHRHRDLPRACWKADYLQTVIHQYMPVDRGAVCREVPQSLAARSRAVGIQFRTVAEHAG